MTAAQGHPLVDGERSGRDLGEDRLQAVRLDLRQEADLAEVHARAAGRRPRIRPGPPAGTCRRRRARRGRRSSAARGRASRARRPAPTSGRCHATPHQPSARSRSSSAASLVGLYAKPIRLTGFTRRRPRPDARRTGRPRRPSDAAGTTSCSRNSRLPSGPRIGEATASTAPSPTERAATTTRRSTSRWTAGSRTTPLSATPRPASNCGLTSGTIDPPAGPKQPAIGPSTRPSEMNETSTTASSTGSAEHARPERPGVRPLERHHPLVAPKPIGELAPTDVDGIDPRGAALEQDVGEAAGRRADVERDQSGRVERERVERGDQLVAAARDVRLRAVDGELDRRVDEIARLAVTSARNRRRRRARGRRGASAWARARDSASPRSTRS